MSVSSADLRENDKPVLQIKDKLNEAGKQRLAGNVSRQANSGEVKALRKELEQMKMMVAEMSLKNRVLKKSLLGLENPLDD